MRVLAIEHAIAITLACALAGCGAPATHLTPPTRLNYMVNLQGLAGANTPWAFNFESIGCVDGPDSLTVSDVTLHAPTSGLEVADWGARDGKRWIRLGVFRVRRHPLTSLGLGRGPWRSHCPDGGEQFVVVLKLTDPSYGTAAGIDVHFTNGTSVWVPNGVGMCVKECPQAVVDEVNQALMAQVRG